MVSLALPDAWPGYRVILLAALAKLERDAITAVTIDDGIRADRGLVAQIAALGLPLDQGAR